MLAFVNGPWAAACVHQQVSSAVSTSAWSIDRTKCGENGRSHITSETCFLAFKSSF
ncbi:MAG: hypothetical protein ACTS4U_01280 [Candidatus Hodgkinia cicadicola]